MPGAVPGAVLAAARELAARDRGLAQWLHDCGVDAKLPDAVAERTLAGLIDALYLYGARREATALVGQWLKLAPASATARFLGANFQRYDLVPAERWRDDFACGFAAGLRQRAFEPTLPAWPGPAHEPEHLLVYGDQGIGDQMRRLAYLHDITGLWPRVQLAVHEKLVPLAARSFAALPVTGMSGQAAALSARYSHVIALGDLEALFWNATHNLLRDSFLCADPVLRATWRARLAAELPGDTLRVGICYRSTLQSAARNVHYTSPDQWLPILGVAGASFVSLQYQADEVELRVAERQAGRTVHRWPTFDPFKDVEALAAVISNLDLVIATTTMVADLSAALGIETWRLQTGAGARSEQSPVNPWYGARTRMFYRSAREPWTDVLTQVATQLAQRTAAIGG